MSTRTEQTTKPRPLWKQYRSHVEVWLVNGLAWLIPFCSRRWVMRFSRGLGILAYAVDRKGRAITLANLEVVLGRQYSLKERRRIALRTYQNLARTFFDLIWSTNIDSGNVHKFVKIISSPELDQLRAEGKPVIITGQHFGHWEFANVLSGHAGFEYMTIGTQIKNAGVDQVVTALRERSGQIMIRKGNAMLRMVKRLKAGKTVAFLVDQSLRPEQSSEVADFFGLPVCVPSIHAEMAIRSGSPIVHIWCLPEEDGTYILKFGPPLFYPPGADVQVIVQETLAVFEDAVRQRPELFLWNYKHWRFKPLHTELRFPFYANVSTKFDSKVRQALLDRQRRAAREAA
jgi:KDO2-lipid IV(A) lauroyltransferase